MIWLLRLFLRSRNGRIRTYLKCNASPSTTDYSYLHRMRSLSKYTEVCSRHLGEKRVCFQKAKKMKQPRDSEWLKSGGEFRRNANTEESVTKCSWRDKVSNEMRQLVEMLRKGRRIKGKIVKKFSKLEGNLILHHLSILAASCRPRNLRESSLIFMCKIPKSCDSSLFWKSF